MGFFTSSRYKRSTGARVVDAASAIIGFVVQIVRERKTPKRADEVFAEPLGVESIHIGATTEAPPLPRPAPIPRELEMVYLPEPPAGGRFAGTKPPEGVN